jgi:hypothetical protein
MNDNLFYRGGRRRSVRSKSGVKVNLPKDKGLAKALFGLVAAVCIVLLFIKGFVFALDKIKSSKVEELAEIHVVTGDVQIASLGSNDYTNVPSGQRLWESDTIRTMSNSRAVVSLFEGTQLRMDESSVVEFVKLEKSGDDSLISINVKTGNVWVNTPQVLVGKTELSVSTKYFNTKFTNARVALTSNLPEYVRVLSGVASLELVDGGSVLNQYQLSAGQQVALSNSTFEGIVAGDNVELVNEIDKRFQLSQWYKWNVDEDLNPTYGYNDSLVIDPSGGGNDSVLFDEDLNGEFIETTEDGIDPALQPVFTSHKNGDVVEGEEVIDITGTVPANTSNVMIVSYEDGPNRPNKYVLKGFTEGDREFLYRAAYDPPTGNLVEGENTYEAIAIDERGQESLATKLVIDYVPAQEEVEEDKSEEEPVVSKFEVDDSLTPLASIDTVNDVAFETGFVLDEKKGVIEGSIGTWAKEVVVNGFSLTLYEAYSGEFRYILSPGFENVVQGDNVLQIFGIDKNGNRSPVVEFVIEYDYE